MLKININTIAWLQHLKSTTGAKWWNLDDFVDFRGEKSPRSWL